MTDAPSPLPPSARRRSLLLGGLAIFAGYWALREGPGLIAGLFPQDLTLTPLRDPKGFRRFLGGETTGRIDPFAGLDRAGDAPNPAAVAQVRASLCSALFGDTSLAPGDVPIASFSDYACPYCRVLTQRLATLAETKAVQVTWHEWPLLGETSVLASRAAIAAQNQGAYLALHKRLMRGRFQATQGYLEAIARDIGIDPGRMAADMNSPATAAQLAQSDALARLFGFVGTPALVVGRTVVQGAITDADLQRLIALELSEGPPPGCT